MGRFLSLDSVFFFVSMFVLVYFFSLLYNRVPLRIMCVVYIYRRSRRSCLGCSTSLSLGKSLFFFNVFCSITFFVFSDEVVYFF